MKFLDWIMDVMSYMANLWSKNSDELINQLRAYEKKIIVYSLVAAIFFTLAMLVSPSIEMMPSDGTKYLTYTVYRNIGFAAWTLGILSFIVSLWNLVELLHFRHQNGAIDY